MTDDYMIARLGADEPLEEVVALEAASFTNPWSQETLSRELRNSDVSRVYVLRAAAGELIAFCACWVIFDELHINTLAVQPAFRRLGLATRLLRHVFADAVAEGVQRATLEVRRSNDPALRLYERLGFLVHAERPGYYSKPQEDGLILWQADLPALVEKPQS